MAYLLFHVEEKRIDMETHKEDLSEKVSEIFDMGYRRGFVDELIHAAKGMLKDDSIPFSKIIAATGLTLLELEDIKSKMHKAKGQ